MKQSAIFSLAFGDGADLSFLRRLSASNNGFARNIYEAADAALQLRDFYREVASPLLANVTFSYLPGQVSKTYGYTSNFLVGIMGQPLNVMGIVHFGIGLKVVGQFLTLGRVVKFGRFLAGWLLWFEFKIGYLPQVTMKNIIIMDEELIKLNRIINR